MRTKQIILYLFVAVALGYGIYRAESVIEKLNDMGGGSLFVFILIILILGLAVGKVLRS